MGTYVPVTFRFPGTLARTARQVAVVGHFNAWDPTAHPLTKTPEGDWITVIDLPPGQVVYRLWVDGTTWLDPYDDGREANVWGSEDSVRCIQQDVAPSWARSA